MEYTFSENDLISTTGFGFLDVDSIQINEDGVKISGSKVKCPFSKIGLFLWFLLTFLSIILCFGLALFGLIVGCIIIRYVLRVPPVRLNPVFEPLLLLAMLVIISGPLFKMISDVMYDTLLIKGYTLEFDTLQIVGKTKWKAKGQHILSLNIIVNDNRGKLCIPFHNNLQLKQFENDLKASNIVSCKTKKAW